MNMKKLTLRLPSVIGIALLIFSNALAQDGTWTNRIDGTWTVPGNWENGIIADGAGSTAAFVADLSSDRTITLGTTTRTIGHLAVTNLNATVRTWTVSSAVGTQYLTFNPGVAGGTSVVCVAANTTLNTGDFAGSTVALRKTGPGVWGLARANVLATGSIHVEEGTLWINNVTSIAGLPVTLGGGDANVALRIGAPTDGATFGGSLSVPATGSGKVTIEKISNGTRSVVNMAWSCAKDLLFNVTVGNLEFRPAMSGGMAVTKTGSGRLYYTSQHSYTGGTTIRQGSIWLLYNGTGSVLPSGGAVTLGDETTGANAVVLGLAGGTDGPRPSMQMLVTTNGTSAIIEAGLDGQNTGNYVVQGTIQIERPSLILRCNNNSTYMVVSSVISGVGGIETRGTDTKMIRINGVNSYQGGTVVTSGRLRVYGSGTLGSGDVTVSAGGTLDLDTGTAISDSAAVSLAVGTSTYGVIDLLSGVEETVGTLTINGQLQYSGTYGATGSGAEFITANHFVGTGKLIVLDGKPRPTIISLR